MANDKEVWEIELELKTQKIADAQKFYDQSLEKIKQGEKRLTAAIINEGRIQTQAKTTELKIQEAKTKAKLAQDIAETKTANAKELLDYKQMLNEKNRLAKESAVQLKAQQKSDSKFTGQSTTLGSVDALNQQIKYYVGLRNAAATNTAEFTTYAAKVNDLTAKKKDLIGTTSKLTSQFNEMKMLIAGGLGLNVLTQFVSSSFNASLDAQKSLMQLKAVTQDNVQLYEQLVSYASQMQNKWGIPDEEIQSLAAFSVAQGRSFEQIKKITEAGRILSVLNKTDLTTGYKIAEQTLEGNTKQLGKMEKDFKTLTEAQKENGVALDIIIDRYGKYADVSDTNYNKTQRTKQIWEETKEGFGDGLVYGVMPLIDGLNNLGLTAAQTGNSIGGGLVGPFTGFLQLIEIIKNKPKEFALAMDAMNNAIPGWGGGIGQLGTWFLDLGGFIDSDIDKVNTLMEAMGGLTGNVGFAKEPEAMGGAKIKPVKKGGSPRGGKTNKDTDPIDAMLTGIANEVKYKELTHTLTIQYLNDQIKVIQAVDTENLKLEQKIKLLEAVNQLRANELFGLKNLPDAKQLDLTNMPGIKMRTGFKLDYINTPDLRPDYTSEDIQRMLDEQIDTENNKLGYAIQIQDKFLSMLQTTGLIDDEFFKILSTIKSFITDGFDLFDAITGLIGIAAAPATGGASLLATGGVIAGGGGGAQGLPNYTMPGKLAPQVTVITNTKLEKMDTYRVYVDGQEVAAKIGNSQLTS